MFEAQTYDVIMQRMLDRVSDDIDKREGSIIWDALSPEALEFARLYLELDNILNIVFARTSYGEYLDLIAESHGIERKSATEAIGYVWLEGVAGSIVEAPVEISVSINDEVIKYIVIDEDDKTIDVQIPAGGSGRYKVVCAETGIKGNLAANSIEFYENITGISRIYNTEAFYGGGEEEIDSSLLQRLLEKAKNPPSSGNINDYTRWTKEIAGAESVKVIPLWNGPGTVKLIVYGAQGMPVTQEVVNNVKEYIDPDNNVGEGKAPLGASITVVTVTIKNVFIEISGLQIQEDYTLESVKNTVQNNLSSYLQNILPSSKVIFKSVEAVIMNTVGVLDFNSLSINGLNTNLTTEPEEKVLLLEVLYIE
jgi:uncharacterized phage protein gp47/JayE